MIPKIIHNIWFQGFHTLPTQIKINQEKIKKKNPEWDFMIWDEKRIVELLQKYPKIYNTYKKVHDLSGLSSIETVKSFLARYVILKEYGGLYYDFAFECISSLNSLFLDKPTTLHLIKKDPIYIANFQREFSTSHFSFPFLSSKYCACFVGMNKNHPVWEKVFECLEKATLKREIENALDQTLQKYEKEFTIIPLTKVNGYYKELNKETICYIHDNSSSSRWLQFYHSYYKQIFLFVLVLLVIFLVEKLYHYNTSLYGAMTYIPGIGAVYQSTKKKNKTK
jgi:hypothetical protein